MLSYFHIGVIPLPLLVSRSNRFIHSYEIKLLSFSYINPSRTKVSSSYNSIEYVFQETTLVP